MQFVGEYVQSKRPSHSEVVIDRAPLVQHWAWPGRLSCAVHWRPPPLVGARRRPWVPVRDRPPAVRRVQFGDR